jgi:hypothetical protein
VKRIAAVAALIVAMLAVPAAAAMAGTSTPGSVSGHAGQSQFCQPNPFQHRHHHNRRHHNRGHHRHHHFFNNCNSPFPLPPAGVCNGASFTFSWGTGFRSIYELSGPTLSTGEQFSFDGSVYTIVNANPTAGSMLLNTINFGPTVFVGTGYLC